MDCRVKPCNDVDGIRVTVEKLSPATLILTDDAFAQEA